MPIKIFNGGDIIATSEAQKQAVKRYQSKMKRIPLDVSIQEYSIIKHAADLNQESVNGYIKKAINMRYAETFKKVYPDMKQALEDHEKGVDILSPDDLEFVSAIVAIVENGVINTDEH